ncbi:MAG: zinc-binding dehydrogenase [Chloroflexia bacterium]|nr:zinc-binding dehydrogenase [Chloroflexia bacterium]
MKAYVVSKPGNPDVLKLQEIETPNAKEGWVLIKVKAFGLNRSEMYTRQGHSGDAVPFPRVLGIECVGEVVDASGSDLLPGQKVGCAMGGMGRKYNGSYTEYALIPRSQVMPVETELDWITFGALPETFFTAYGAITEDMQVKMGNTVLVRGGTSSVGLAAISILKDIGTEIIATTRKQERIEKLHQTGADYVVIDDGKIAMKVKEIVPAGVDSLLELVGSKNSLEDSIKCMKAGGVICGVGILGNEWDYQLPGFPDRIIYKSHTTEKVETETHTPILQNIVKRVEDGRYQPNIFKVFDFSDVVEAHKMMEESRAFGKIMINVNS